jgi:hypothetical protein
MHAAFPNNNRHKLVERAKLTFLRDIQHVIVEGGPNDGSLLDEKYTNSELTAKKGEGEGGHGDTTREFLKEFRSQKNFIEYWNSSWGYNHDTLLSPNEKEEGHRRLFTVSYPDNPGCGITASVAKSKECDTTFLSEPSYVRIGKYYGAQVRLKNKQ